MSKIDVATRERFILQYLKEHSDAGASIREIYDQACSELKDSVTLQAYYKIVDRLQAAGKIEVIQEDPNRGRVYRTTATLHPGNPMSLDDVYELLPFFATTEALASVINAQDYFEENLHTVVKRAAEGLLEEDPVELYYNMIIGMIELVHADQAIVFHSDGKGNAEIADKYSIKRLEQDYRDLEHIVYRGLSIPTSVVKLPGLTQFRDFGANILYDPAKLHDALRFRVFGERFIRKITVKDEGSKEARQRLTVSGSDGSMHAGTLAIRTARGFYEDVSDVITFNNSIAYVRLSDIQSAQEDRVDMVHSAPFTRQTIDDPSYKGMVLAPSLFPDLSESEYEHMARCATDVVQFRVDEAVFTGGALDLRTHSQIPKPQVHIRDGTIAPQEREFGHYNRPDPYGEMVREGIRLERKILERIISGGEKAPIFAGAVKSTQTRLFVHALNWYIKQGSKARFGAPIASDWDAARAAGISDNAAMTALLSTLPVAKAPDAFYVTCALLRKFPSLTEFYDHNLGKETWLDFFEARRKRSVEDNQKYGGTLPYHAVTDLADDDYIFMCNKADYVSFYVGHTAGDPAPMIPRYEFLTSLRMYEDEDPTDWTVVANRVDNCVKRIIDAIDTVGLSIDRDHNYLSNKTMVKIIPFPIYQAHEYVKTLGRKLEAELKSMVISHLIQIKKLQPTTTESDVEVRPVSIRRYLEHFDQARKKLLGDGDEDVR